MSKACLLVLAVLLLTALPATAADAPRPAPQAAPLALAGAPVLALCQATRSVLAPASLRTTGVACGSCSVPTCAGETVGWVCFHQGERIGHCQTSSICTADGSANCACVIEGGP
jgi:hypothetical protein